MSEESVMWIARDITERKLAERPLKEANEPPRGRGNGIKNEECGVGIHTQQLWQASETRHEGELSASIAMS